MLLLRFWGAEAFAWYQSSRLIGMEPDSKAINTSSAPGLSLGWLLSHFNGTSHVRLIAFIPPAQRLPYWGAFWRGRAFLPIHGYRSFWDALPHEAFTSCQRCWQQSFPQWSLWLKERHSWKRLQLTFSILLKLRSSFAWARVCNAIAPVVVVDTFFIV